MSFYLDLNVGAVSTRYMLSRLNKCGHRQGCFAGVQPTMHVQPTGLDGNVLARLMVDILYVNVDLPPCVVHCTLHLTMHITPDGRPRLGSTYL